PHQFDIHGGGIDLIFPHHENEIAQSRCAHGTPAMAQVWMHNGYLQVEGQKMSKSLGNFITVHDLLETEKFGGRKWPGEVLRLAMLMTHYRQPLDFSSERLALAEHKLRTWHDSLYSVPSLLDWGEKNVKLSPSNELIEHLADDLNTHAVIAFLDHEAKVLADDTKAQLFIDLLTIGIDIDSFDRTFRQIMGDGTDSMEIETLLRARLTALANKDFATADRIRAELLEQGIQLMDYKDPETGERRTKWEVKR
ncbi:MAG TPA: class I tRNA ligase family protein, partial [Devosiaceae bacterium]